jgi:hypothetical protein
VTELPLLSEVARAVYGLGAPALEEWCYIVWDGFFVGEAVWSIDTWVTLAAATIRTARIRLGTMLTPLPLIQPWKLASESVTLDHLSQGRVILSLGMGAVWMGWQAFPDLATDHARAPGCWMRGSIFSPCCSSRSKLITRASTISSN